MRRRSRNRKRRNVTGWRSSSQRSRGRVWSTCRGRGTELTCERTASLRCMLSVVISYVLHGHRLCLGVHPLDSDCLLAFPFDGLCRRILDMNPHEQPERLDEACDGEDAWTDWFRLTPQQRWEESAKNWQFYLQVGGSLDPEPDSQSPFDAIMPRGQAPAYGRAGVRVLRRGRV